jgi:hypothetical protein
MLRWQLTTAILILLREFTGVQIMLLTIISIVNQILIIYGKPFELKTDNYMSLFNEFMVSIYIYGLILLTDFQSSRMNKDSLALILLYVISITLGVNCLKFLFLVGRDLLVLWRIRWKRMMKAKKEDEPLKIKKIVSKKKSKKGSRFKNIA